jgi:hypothetical protein
MTPVRRLVVTGAVLAALIPAAAVNATTPTEPTEPTDSAMTETTEAVGAPPAGDTVATDENAQPATVFDDSGNPVASVLFQGSEIGWSDYEEGNDPDAGNEYVRVMVTVESLITEGTFNVNVDDFILQSNNGFLTTAETIATAAQAEADEEITDEADLANGESLDLTLTFQVVSSIGPQSVFYRPDDDILVDIAELASDAG